MESFKTKCFCHLHLSQKMLLPFTTLCKISKVGKPPMKDVNWNIEHFIHCAHSSGLSHLLLHLLGKLWKSLKVCGYFAELLLGNHIRTSYLLVGSFLWSISKKWETNFMISQRFDIDFILYGAFLGMLQSVIVHIKNVL